MPEPVVLALPFTGAASVGDPVSPQGDHDLVGEPVQLLDLVDGPDADRPSMALRRHDVNSG